MAELLGKFLGQFPLWLSLPVAFIICIGAIILWLWYVDPWTSVVGDRRRNVKKREQELEKRQYGKR